MSKRRQNFQNIAWFLDLYRRQLLDMDPPYQRRSVWNRSYQESFIDTILLDYPAPAIFLFSRVSELGATTFEIVDGKQRLTTIFDFVNGDFPIGDDCPLASFRGLYFTTLPSDTKIPFYEYDFSVEYLPTNNEEVINSIFDRLNRNVAKLTNQELRHARFDGKFIEAAEDLTEWMGKTPGLLLPRIAPSSRRQMKDVEITATILLFLEVGPRRFSVEEFDVAFAERDKEWERKEEITDEFKRVMEAIRDMVSSVDGEFIPQSRFRNQADYYSLFAAVAELRREGAFPDQANVASQRLSVMNSELESPSSENATKVATSYLEAARSGSHDTNQRKTRISIAKHVLTGTPLETWKKDDTAGH